MSFHARGVLQLKSDDGVVLIYEVETFGQGMVLRDSEGEYHYITDKPPVLIDRLKKDISDLTHSLKLKREELSRLIKE
jgi:hypothetical protein